MEIKRVRILVNKHIVKQENGTMKIVKKTYKNYTGTVHDLTVENSHSYNVEGLCVHNSAAGSLLSWCLDITKIDPLQFGLYFERFLNPSRNSPPDLDIDFMTGTDDVTTEFLYKKYGKERVFPVGTFLTFNEKGCIKDVVRAHFGGEYTGFDSDVAQVTKEMPDFNKVDYDLAWWFENYPHMEECSPNVKRWLLDPENKVVLEQTLKLQGQPRGFGQHAAGVVITPGPSWEYIPTNMIVTKQSIVSAFQEADGSSKDLSYLGILKLDRLKLSTMNIIMDCIQMIKSDGGPDLFDVLMNIDEHFDDKNLYQELMLGQNHGIFQFESPGMNAMLRGIEVERFDEMAAANALYRPGPMGIGAHRIYIDNKRFPNQTEYPSELIKPILQETNGVMVFQEQVQFIAKEVAGMDLGEGDLLRRALDKAAKSIKKINMGDTLTEEEKNHKNFKAYQEYWGKFLKGAELKGVAKEEVDKILAYMSDYLGYSFNKCLSKNSLVQTKNRGQVPILEVIIGEEVKGYNPEIKQDEWVLVKARHNNGRKKLYRIKTKSGKVLECTLDHKIMTSKGMKTLREIRDRNLQVKISSLFEELIETEEIGFDETYDLEIDSEYHNFYANDVCVSNSHSVSYAFIAMQTLYLKHYYPTYFYTALLNMQKASNAGKEKEQQWLTQTVTAAMSKGIKINPPSRKSKWRWSMTGPQEITMGFSSINGIGESAYNELMERLRIKKKSLNTITMAAFFDLQFNSFSKKAFEVCLKTGMFDDWSSSRDYLADLFQKQKTKNKRKLAKSNQFAMFDIDDLEYTHKIDHNKFPVTSGSQKRDDFIEVCGFDMNDIQRISNIHKNMDELQKKSKKPLLSLTHYNGEGFYWFIIEDILFRHTKKGKDYITIIAGDGIDKVRFNIFEPTMSKLLPEIQKQGVYVGKFVKNDQGWLNYNSRNKLVAVMHAYEDKLLV